MDHVGDAGLRLAASSSNSWKESDWLSREQ